MRLADHLRPGDGVAWTQACGEPVPLVDALLASDLPLRAFVGPTWRDALAAKPDTLEVVSYGAIGRTADVPGLRIVPCHHSAIPGLFAAGALPGDVVLLSVSPPDADGRCSFGVGCDYIADAARHARVVLAEVNDRMPRTAGTTIAYADLTATLHTSRPLPEAPRARETEINRLIAGRVAALIADGDTLQIGVGGLPDAILAALTDRRGLAVHSGMISDGLMDLVTAGVVSGPVVVGAALGSQRLFDALDGEERVVFRPVSHTHDPAVLAGVENLVAINAAVEVDLTGQVNGERLGDRALGAVGGMADFLRAARTAIVALPAARIVEELSGPVSVSRADVDWVVTEHGARSLHGRSDRERVRMLREIAGS